MTAHFAYVGGPARTKKRAKIVARTAQKGVVLSRAAQASLEDQVEDIRFNAIADERAEGPFVQVSLDDL